MRSLRKRRARRAGRGPDEPLTYPEVGGTQWAELPTGYDHVRRSAVVGRGEPDFRRAVEELMTWQAQRRAGLVVRESPRVAEGSVVWLGAALGPLHVGCRCRVVAVVDDERRKGFAYGTLPGHPECGEESFLVIWRDDDAVELQVVAFSRPGTWWSNASGPIGGVVQHWLIARYLKALRQPER